jgi:polyphosphate glucokinase
MKSGVVGTAANLGPDWIGKNLADMINATTDCPTCVNNDADAAGLAEMRFGVGKQFSGGTVLFLTIGTGIGAALFTQGVLWPNAELGHMQIRGKDAENRAWDGVRQEGNLSWKKWGKKLQEVLQVYDFLFNPDVMILGGGVSKKFDKFSSYLKDISAKIVPAELRNQAGIVGAAMAAEEML